MKFNKRMLWSTIAVLLAGIFIIIAFFALEFRYKITNSPFSLNGEDLNMKLSLDKFKTMSDDPSSPSWIESIYGCGISGIVFMFIAIALPVISMFYTNNKVNKYLGWSTLGLVALGLVLSVAAIAVFVGKIASLEVLVNGELNSKLPMKITINAGYTAGQFIFTIVGGALAISGTSISYKDYLTK